MCHLPWKMLTDTSLSAQLYINGEFVGGADIVEEMHTKGELKEMLLG